jgi:glycosyltransferase involved in cell wall biosynthesis
MRVAMLLHKSVEHDSRVRRAARALAEAGHEVTVLHLPRVRGELDGPLDGFSVRSVTPPAWVRRRLPSTLYRLVFFAAFVRAAGRLRPDIVHAHDAAMLAPGWAAARLTGAKLVYDSHEYAAGVPYRNRTWTLLVTALERLLIRRCAATITVSDGIADRLQTRYALRNRPVVVRNIPDPAEHDPDFEAPDLRDSLGIAPGTPLVLHLGAVARDRGCETLVRAMAHLPEAHLLFLGADDSAYASGLRELAGAEGVGERTHFRPSVPVAQIRAHTRQASVGVSLLEDTCENHRLALPNKVFEYIEAGVPVVASDLPELRRLIVGTGAGKLVDAVPDRVATAIRDALVDGGPGRSTGPGAGGASSWSEEARRLVRLVDELGLPPGGGPRAAIVVRNAVSHDARVLREAGVLEAMGYDVTVIGAAPGPTREEVIAGTSVRLLRVGLRRQPRAAAAGARPGRPGAGPPVADPAKVRLAQRGYRWLVTADWNLRALAELRRVRPRLCHCNDYNTIWVGAAAKLVLGSRLVYDSHELWADRNLRPEWRPWLLASEAVLVRSADRVLATSPGHANAMSSRYRLQTPLVVRNVPDLPPVTPTPVGDPPVAAYFGAITRGRGLEEAIMVLTRLPELRIRVIGPEAWGFGRVLAELAAELGVSDRLSLEDPVDPRRATEVLSSADVGLALIQPTCESYRLALPNKVFEYTLAGLPILATDLPVLGEFVSRRGLGSTVAAGDVDGIARALTAMLEPDVYARHATAVVAAQEHLTWAHESGLLADAYRAVACL